MTPTALQGQQWPLLQCKANNDPYCSTRPTMTPTAVQGRQWPLLQTAKSETTDISKWTVYVENLISIIVVSCCSNILLSSTSQATIDGFSLLGKYIPYATQTEINGKKVYIKEGDTRYCLRTPVAGGNWVLGVCSDLTVTSG